MLRTNKTGLLLALVFSTVAFMFRSATLAQAQRTSTFEEDAAYRFAEGDRLGEARLASPQECRDRCIGDRACGAWLYASGINQCLMMRRTTAAREAREAPKETDILKVRWYTGRIEDAAASVTPSTAVASSELFPLPRPGTEITFQYNKKQQYARIRFLENKSHRTLVEGRGWEGPISAGSQAAGTGWNTLDVPHVDNCSISVGDEQLRALAVGQEVYYERKCVRPDPRADKPFEADQWGWFPQVVTITYRTKRRVVGWTRVTTAAGAFDAIEVHHETDEEHISTSRNEIVARQEIRERSVRYFVPALGYFVRETKERIAGARSLYSWLADRYREAGEKVPSGGTLSQQAEAVAIVGHASAVSAPGRITITSATLGANCGAKRGNVTDKVAAICNGKDTCALPGARVNNPDPAFGCAKAFAAEWKCMGTGGTRKNSVPAIANEKHVLTMSCK